MVTISLNTSLDFGISTDGTLGAVLSVLPSFEERFDGIRGTQAWISVTW